MLCEICKRNEATGHYVQIAQTGSVLDLMVCDDCASKLLKQRNKTQFNPPKSKNWEQNVVTGRSVSGILSSVCHSCGTTFDQFKRKGYFGCKDCYASFLGNLGEIQKVFGGSNLESIEELEEELNKAVTDERFEDAAVIRDKIRMMFSPKKENKKTQI
ncbi:MAG TPA: UvrB/UvrC motif-containing protein [Caldisericia bacterium]|nr:UvrB/UvrC motif-containing protein [Caldisericia bacterium]HPF48905.1 UvrB/UvrC motif-containing protein [Caldisericia bacterium]HPI83231.1 UvrB/UvrC motif-containing protein [Caldisericia bacterium]HPQ92458.1 UvrB/UvrC motif-containing protein [Caldisericia bacterium]HRV74444.1 UvrB/UvrC motif-containing protein [Caldisericia bacterium]